MLKQGKDTSAVDDGIVPMTEVSLIFLLLDHPFARSPISNARRPISASNTQPERCSLYTHRPG